MDSGALANNGTLLQRKLRGTLLQRKLRPSWPDMHTAQADTSLSAFAHTANPWARKAPPRPPPPTVVENECTRSSFHGYIVPSLCTPGSETLHQLHVAEVIPVIGTAVLNRGDWLLRLVYSIDMPVRKLVIVRNTIPGGPDSSDVDDAISELKRQLGEAHLRILVSNANLGCGPSWNLIMRQFPADYWVLPSADVAYRAGQLARLVAPISTLEKTTGGIVLANGSYANLALTHGAVRRAGYFDENIWPAYTEDCDYSFRLFLVGAKVISTDIGYIHGEEGASGSLTHQLSDRYEIRKRNSMTHFNNFKYLNYKWGIPSSNEECTTDKLLALKTYATPYNDSSLGIDDWKFFSRERAVSEAVWNFTKPTHSLMFVPAIFAGAKNGEVGVQLKTLGHI